MQFFIKVLPKRFHLKMASLAVEGYAAGVDCIFEEYNRILPQEEELDMDSLY